MEIYELSALDIADKIKNKEISALEVFDSCMKRAVSHEGKIGAFITMTMEEGREDAGRVDSKLARGEPAGRLAGVPFAVKDNITVRGLRTTAGSKMLSNWTSPYSANVVELLRSEGAVLLGKTNMAEFAVGFSTETSAYGITSNPWDISRVPGGSSGGSAAAVAAGYFPFSLGSDTGGSVRQPAAFCGIYGLKPTYGMVSRYGLIAYASSLDQIGVFTRSLSDLELIMQIISAPDKRDSTCASGLHVVNFKGGSKAKRIGIVKEFMDFEIDPAIREAQENAIEFLRGTGIETVEISLPVTSGYAVPCYYAIVASEANSNLARFDGVRYGHSVKDASSLSDLYTRSRTESFGIEVKRRIIAGTYLTEPDKYDKYYTPALKVRQLISQELTSVFSEADIILLPSTPMLAPKRGEMEDPMTEHVSDIYMVPANLAGLPAMSFNAGCSKSTNLPIGLQLIGKRWSDPDLIATAKLLESCFGEPKTAKGVM